MRASPVPRTSRTTPTFIKGAGRVDQIELREIGTHEYVVHVEGNPNSDQSISQHDISLHRRYVRIPTEDPSGAATSETSQQPAFAEVSIPHSQLSVGAAAAGNHQARQHLLKLLGQLVCVGCFFAGRKCGPTLFVAIVLYFYVNGFLVSSCLSPFYIYIYTWRVIIIIDY